MYHSKDWDPKQVGVLERTSLWGGGILPVLRHTRTEHDINGRLNAHDLLCLVCA